jgi:hypothetical protein
MVAILAYFLGVITVVLVLVSFWLLSQESSKIREVYDKAFCQSL